MDVKFVVNDYVLIWNLLFQASISEEIHNLKQKIWVNYKKEYNRTLKDNEKILKDPKNFIPDNDVIYNTVLENKCYEKLKKKADKFRVKLLETWDENKKNVVKELKDILRFDIKMHHVLVVCEELNIIDVEKFEDAKMNTVVWGKKLDTDNSVNSIIELIYEIIKKELKNYREEYKDIVDAIVELAIVNEFATRLTGVTHYLNGDNSLKYLKRQIYPYWLMYLGVEQDKMNDYMNRDKIGFDAFKYTYERQLKKLDIYDFIDFCIRNQKYILKIDELEII